jgi:hypothetical protein
MMVDVTDNGFRFDDESEEELRQAWASGERVLVVPSRRRLQFRQSVSRLLRVVADDLERVADRVDLPEGVAAASRHRRPRAES